MPAASYANSEHMRACSEAYVTARQLCMTCRKEAATMAFSHLHPSSLVWRLGGRGGDSTAFPAAAPRGMCADFYILLLGIPLLLGGRQHIRAAQRQSLCLHDKT